MMPAAFSLNRCFRRVFSAGAAVAGGGRGSITRRRARPELVRLLSVLLTPRPIDWLVL